MTIEEVIAGVEDETGQKVTAKTMLDSLGMDSLDFLSLMVRFGISDNKVAGINTVNDIFLAVQ